MTKKYPVVIPDAKGNPVQCFVLEEGAIPFPRRGKNKRYKSNAWKRERDAGIFKKKEYHDKAKKQALRSRF